MQVLVIGASGLVGSAVYNLFKYKPGFEVVGTYRNYKPNDIDAVYFDPLDPASNYVFEKKWDLVVQTAALTNVDLCESEPERSYRETVIANRVILESVAKNNPECWFVLISTDYVFDGSEGPYSEDSPTNPINIYGIHKLICENETKNTLKNHAIIRVTNVFGEEERNKNFIARILKSNQDGQVLNMRAPYDQFATPVWSGDIAKAIDIIFEKKATGIFHAAGTDYLNRLQLTLRILEFLEDNVSQVVPSSTKELQQAAPRPLLGGLLNRRLYQLFPELSYISIDQFLKIIVYDKKSY